MCGFLCKLSAGSSLIAEEGDILLVNDADILNLSKLAKVSLWGGEERRGRREEREEKEERKLDGCVCVRMRAYESV